MTITIDKRFLGLFALMCILHVASLWTDISRFFSASSVVPIPDQNRATVTITPETLDQWKQATKAKQQIVQTDQTGKQEKPDDSAFLGEKDMSFDRQTIARKVDVFNRAGKGSNTTADNRANQAAKQIQKAQDKLMKKALKDLKLSDLGMAAASMPLPEKQPASAGQKGIRNGDANSRGVSSTNDYVEHVGLGDFTQLNTVEYKYYGFFHRIRQKLEQFWGQSLKEKADALYKSGRRIPASDMYTTALMITLDSEGQIVKVQVKSSSGVRELDEAATESFNKAGPFPNPPRDMLVNGRTTIEWGFVVQS